MQERIDAWNKTGGQSVVRPRFAKFIRRRLSLWLPGETVCFILP